MTFNRKKFEESKIEYASSQSKDKQLQKVCKDFIVQSDKFNYGYQWTWLGLPLIQLPADIIMTQEIIWKCKPEVIIETGVAWGGSVVFHANLLSILGRGRVIGIDKVLPKKNIDKINSFPFSSSIKLIKGSSIDSTVIKKVKTLIPEGSKVMVILDSNHTTKHVSEELSIYADLVSKNSYLIVCDTILNFIPNQNHRKREFNKSNNPKIALDNFLKNCDKFEVDQYYNNKILTSFSPTGYLKKIRK